MSFANCGLPYFVGGVIEDEDDLTLQTPEQLFDRFRLDVRVHRKSIAIDRLAHTVVVRSTTDRRGVRRRLRPVSCSARARRRCDRRSRATTACARCAPSRSAARLEAAAEDAPDHAVVIGAGFIGLEMAENLVAQGIDVTIVEAAPQVLPPFDPELAVLVGDELARPRRAGSRPARPWHRSASAHVALADGRIFPADLVVGAIGVRPDAELARAAGLELGPNGGIAVDDANRTSDPDIYAVGDVVEKPDAISRATSLIALANVANRQGRRVADHIAGRPSHSVASLGTAIVKVFDLVAATVGWNERRLDGLGRPPPRDPLAPVRPRDLLPGRDADGGEADLRPRRRHDPRRPDRRAATASTNAST